MTRQTHKLGVPNIKLKQQKKQQRMRTETKSWEVKQNAIQTIEKEKNTFKRQDKFINLIIILNTQPEKTKIMDNGFEYFGNKRSEQVNFSQEGR